MKGAAVILLIKLVIGFATSLVAQEIPPAAEQQLENQTDADQAETEDDNWLLEMQEYKKHPLLINRADENELKQLRILSGLQISHLLSYRKLFGNLVSVYELQAVPGWDIYTIKRILPYISVDGPVGIVKEAGHRFRNGDHSLLVRLTRVLEKAKGFDHANPGIGYLGDPLKMMLRYRYSYKNLLQFGVVGEKDAGEQFFKGAQKTGFDFYSFHFFTRKLGLIQALALGDFTVNMGQGLIQWQSLAFKKSPDVMGIKRQSPVLRPYNSSGEFYFNRGAGITLQKKQFESTFFISLRRLSANLVPDTLSNEEAVSSFLNSGYHRTASENNDKNSLQQLSFGSNLACTGRRFHAGVNGVYYHFSHPVSKREEPYNLYAIRGENWYNVSADYSYTYRNLHLFGEAALDKNFHSAFVNGLLISADPRIDLALFYRNISPAYQAVYGNAFTENNLPSNETGWYAGITIRPAAGWKIDGYADIYRFPWLKYQVDAPSAGADYLLQCTFTPGKEVELYARFRSERKQANQPENVTAANYLAFFTKTGWRTQLSYLISRALTVRTRAELLWYDHPSSGKETGFLLFTDLLYAPPMGHLSGNFRLQYFETGGYDSRIYAYENDVLYAYSIPAFFDKGYRAYINLHYHPGNHIAYWFRLAGTLYPEKSSTGTGLDETNKGRRTEITLQARWSF